MLVAPDGFEQALTFSTKNARFHDSMVSPANSAVLEKKHIFWSIRVSVAQLGPDCRNSRTVSIGATRFSVGVLPRMDLQVQPIGKIRDDT